MLKNYFKIAFRNIARNKIHSLINVTGLSVGLASTFIILLYSFNQLSYDKYNKNLDRIYLVTTHLTSFKWTAAGSPFPLGPVMKDQFPEVKEFARWNSSRCNVEHYGKVFQRVRCISADPSIFRILTLPVLSGSLAEVFNGRSSAVITQSIARRIFGVKDPIGDVLTIEWQGTTYDLKVAAVMKDIPRTSTIKGDIVVPLFISANWTKKLWSDVDKKPLESWDLQTTHTYVLLSSAGTVNQLQSQLISFSRRHSNENNPSVFQLFPLKDVYFGSAGFVNSTFPTGDKAQVNLYLAIAFLTLLIACMNFVILATGRSSVRTKEIGVRKVVGASRSDLVKQVLSESVLTSLLALPVSLLLVEISLPYITPLLGENLPSGYLDNVSFVGVFAAIAIIVGLVSGSYVSFYLSGFRPVDILKNRTDVGGSRGMFIRVLVGIEMVIFIGLISASITIYRQLLYFNQKDLGFDKKNLLVFYCDPKEMRNNFEAFRSELMSNPQIAGVCGAIFLPATESRAVGQFHDKLNPSKTSTFEFMSVDPDFIETMGLKMLQGNGFSQVSPGELKSCVILNQTAVQAFDIKDPLTQQFNGQRIIGIVKDFNLHSFREKIPPIAISCGTEYLREVAVRAERSSDIPGVIKFVEAESKAFNDEKPMEYQTFDDRLTEMYGSDYKFAEMIGYFTGLAILVACLGLFGVSLFAAQRRVKEIGIRKVMGASFVDVVGLLTREFVALVLIASVISTPFMIYFMDKWLQNYAFHVDFDVYDVLLTFILAIVIVLPTVGYEAFRAATANPVESLRYE